MHHPHLARALVDTQRADLRHPRPPVHKRRRAIPSAVKLLAATLAAGILGASGGVAFADEPTRSVTSTSGSEQAVAPNPFMDAIVIRGCGSRGWHRSADGHIYCN